MDFPISTFPVGVLEHETLHIITGPTPLIGADGIQHPAGIWNVWTAEHWQQHRPHWQFLTMIDAPPAEVGPDQVAVRQPVDAWEVDTAGGTVTVTYELVDLTPAELAARLVTAKVTAIARINAEAGAARAAFITIATGQEGTYAEKAREARAFAADPAPVATAYPYLAAEAQFTGRPIEEIAGLVNATADIWTAINAEIEGRRRGALVAVDAAATPAAVLAIFPIAWPKPAAPDDQAPPA